MRTSQENRPTTAVIGAGIAGLTAAYLLSRTHQVTLLEADQRLGGHAHTHQVGGQPVDSGFIVYNHRTYPLLTRLFAELGVTGRRTEMSLSVSCDGCGLEYAGGRGAGAILAQPGRLADPRFVRLLTEIPRFHRLAREVLAADDRGGGAGEAADTSALSWGGFLSRYRFPPFFVQHFAAPLVASVWSAGHGDALRYPAAYLFRFLDRHGMLSVSGSPAWQTVTGGSRSYVDAIAAAITAGSGRITLGVPVRAVVRHDDGVEVRTAAEVTRFDQVVLATHADDALDLLADATAEEKALLGEFGYSANPTWLHRDSSVLPRARRARSSWNLRLRSCTDSSERVRVSYWMNRLQGLTGPDDHLVTLNPEGWVDPAAVTARMTYRHPVFTAGSVAAAERLRSAGGPRLAFAGAHLGWGFHEDGCRSGVAAARRFGAEW